MTAIYSITNLENGKRYIGKSKNPEKRWCQHKRNLSKEVINKKQTNPHLFNSVKKHGIKNFKFEILEKFENINEAQLKESELKWMDHYNSCDRNFGYNLRRDSATNCITHPETIKLIKQRHASGKYYTDEWKRKLGKASTEMWKDEEKKNTMAQKVKMKKRKYAFNQYTKEGIFIKQWVSVEEILEKHPNWKWQNIYSVCNGYKPTYRSFIWENLKLTDRSDNPNNIKGITPAHRFDQYTKEGKFIKRWVSYKEIRLAHPGINCANIYAACNGRSPTALNYIWKKVISDD